MTMRSTVALLAALTSVTSFHAASAAEVVSNAMPDRALAVATPSERAAARARDAEAILVQMKDALARRDQPGIHALSNSYVATLRDVQTRTVAAMRQGSDPSAGLQATDDSVRRQAILLAELRRNAPTSTQRDLSRSLDAANHGQVVSSQRLAAIRAWRESGTGGPPPWAGRGGGPGGDPKHPAHGRAGHPSKGQANDDSGDDDARGQGTNGGGRHSEHGHGGGHGQGKGHGKR